MNETQILPFERKHLDWMQLQKHEETILDFDRFSIVSTGTESVTKTYLYRGEVLGVGGYYRMWPGVIEVFVVPTSNFFRYPKQAYKLCKQYFKDIVDTTNAHRIQTASLDCSIRNRFMIRLGFTCEGTMKGYTSTSQNYKMWAIVKGN